MDRRSFITAVPALCLAPAATPAVAPTHTLVVPLVPETPVLMASSWTSARVYRPRDVVKFVGRGHHQVVGRSYTLLGSVDERGHFHTI